MLLSFDRLEDGPGLEIIDHIEHRQCIVRTTDPVAPEETAVDAFQFPVDRGVRFRARAMSIPHRVPISIWNSAGFRIDELTAGESRTLPEDRYIVEMSPPIKLFVVIEGELAIDVTADDVNLVCDRQREVIVYARSYHENPAATITTSDDPEAMMAAVSALGSALKTTTVERSYPTLRGHPPTIELGDELHVPPALDPPDTGVTIEIPPELRYIYVIAPLAYYLGAEVVSGPVPRLVTRDGFAHELDDPRRGFEGEVERVLKQTFFLDCLTRTEGIYPVNLHERNVLEDDLDLDFGTLYDDSLRTQLETYLSIPYRVVEPEIPQWKLTAQIQFEPEHVEVLPFVVNDLAVVQTARERTADEPVGGVGEPMEPVRAGDFTRGVADSTSESRDSASTLPLVRPAKTDSLEQTWIGAGAPIGASKGMVEAYRNRLDRQPADGDIDITVVCNDPAMNDERDIVDDIYGSREELPFDIHGYHELTVEALRDVLERDSDFLHYIGHIDDQGFECSNGYLDAATLDHTNVETFLLNACTSYQQGMELIRAGSIAGVVTIEDVINSGAERVGSSLAKLLNYGFPLGAALNIAKDQSVVGGLYLVLGDGGIDIAQAKSSVPAVCELADDDNTVVTYHTYPTFEMALGSITLPHAGDNSEFYLVGGESGCFELTTSQLLEFLSLETQPVRYESQLFWTDEVDFSEIHQQ